MPIALPGGRSSLVLAALALLPRVDRLHPLGLDRQRPRHRLEAPLRRLAARDASGSGPAGAGCSAPTTSRTSGSSALIGLAGLDRRARLVDRASATWRRPGRGRSRRSSSTSATQVRRDGGLYIHAKAVVVPASLVMLLVLAALLAPGAAGRSGSSRSSSSRSPATRPSWRSATPCRAGQPPPRAGRASSTRSRARGSSRSPATASPTTACARAEVSSPAFNAEIRVDLAGDEEPAPADRLRLGADARCSTTSPTRSPPARSTRARRRPAGPWSTRPTPTGSGSGPARRRRSRSSTRRPARAAIFRCNRPKFRRLPHGGRAGAHLAAAHGDREAALLEGRRHHGALGEGGWPPTRALRSTTTSRPARRPASRSSLPPGRWELSLQYVSPVTGVTVKAPGLGAHLPAGVDAAIPYRPDQGPYLAGRDHHEPRAARHRQRARRTTSTGSSR